MSYIGKNIKKIRTVKNLSQAAFAQLFNLARPSVGAYEEGRSEPKIDTLVQIAQHFGISVDLLLTKELTINELYGFDIFKKGLSKENVLKRIAATEQNQIPPTPLVTASVADSYPSNYLNQGFLEALPTVSLPLKQTTTNTRAFELTTNELTDNLKKGDVLICTAAVKDVSHLQTGQTYVVVTPDKIHTGRLQAIKQSKKLFFGASPSDASDFEVNMKQVLELWETVAVISYLPTAPDIQEDKVSTLEKKVQDLVSRIEKLEKKDLS